MAFADDLKASLRALRRGKGFTWAAVVMLALGVGATTAMFSVVNGVLLRPLALRQPGQLFMLGQRVPQLTQSPDFNWFASPPEFQAWHREATDFSGLSELQSTTFTLAGSGRPRLLQGAKVSTNFFNVLDVPVALGRNFVPADLTTTAPPMIITDRLWRSVFGSDPGIIGRYVGLGSSGTTIIGVLPAWFQIKGRELGPMLDGSETAFFRPLVISPEELASTDVMTNFNYTVIGRLKPGVTREQALAQLNVIQARLARQAHVQLAVYGDLIGIKDYAVAESQQALWLLLAGVGAVLLIICVNLGGLWMTRLADRRREWAIRTSLGAAPGQLARQLLFESIVLGLAGGAAGVFCAALSLNALLAAAPASIPRLDEVHLDWRVLTFGLGLAVIAGLLTGLIPAIRLARMDPHGSLKEASGSTTADPGSLRSRRGLIALQAALSTLLLTAAGLLGLSFYRLLSQPSGFQAAHAYAADVSLGALYSDAERTSILQQMPAAMESVAGITSAGFTSHLPLQGETWIDSASVPGKTYTQASRPSVNVRFISPGYMATLGIPMLAGREYLETDRKHAAIVISAAAARLLWPGVDPRSALGKAMGINGKTWTIVGVADDVRASLTSAPPAIVYQDYWGEAGWIPYRVSLVVRSTLPLASLAAPLRDAIWKLAPNAPIPKLRALNDLEAEAVAPQRYQLLLLLTFAGLALFLAALGVYALVSHSVARRAKELAIRISLGASGGAIWSAIVREALTPVIAGLAVGLVAALFAGNLLTPMLFQTRATSPAVFGVVAACVGLAGLLACLAPARHAVKTDPLLALRAE